MNSGNCYDMRYILMGKYYSVYTLKQNKGIHFITSLTTIMMYMNIEYD